MDTLREMQALHLGELRETRMRAGGSEREVEFYRFPMTPDVQRTLESHGVSAAFWKPCGRSSKHEQVVTLHLGPCAYSIERRYQSLNIGFISNCHCLSVWCYCNMASNCVSSSRVSPFPPLSVGCLLAPSFTYPWQGLTSLVFMSPPHR